MKFIGREDELAQLERELELPEERCILVCGRRRVGKSELLKQAIRQLDMPAIYYECRRTSEADNMASLSELACASLGLPSLSFAGIRDLIEFLFHEAEKRPITLVLDEYPFLREAVAGLDSILQTSIDGHRDSSRLKIVLCGSFVDIMKSLVEHENPLYGRIDLSIKLKPMDFHDAAAFCPAFTPEDKVRLYSVFGGIPYYMRLIDPARSVRDNIIALVSAPGARLEDEVEGYLGSEIRKIANANKVFAALAQGYTRWRDLLDQSHVSSGPAMTDVLSKLIDLELVQKRAPINEPENRRRSGYHIVDPLSLFWYRYIFRNASARQLLDPGVFYERYIERDFEENHVPHLFEDICRQYLIRENRQGAIEPPFDAIGTYWYDNPAARTNGEFDVVTHDPQGYAFYEAEFRKTPITQRMIDEEIEQVKACGMPCHRYGFFSRSDFDAKPAPDTVLIDLADMYS